MHQIACPHCAARLRLKDKSFAGRNVECPDCRQQITVELASGGELTAKAGPTTQATGKRTGPWASPALAAWLVALLGFAALLVYVFRGDRFSTPAPVVDSPPIEVTPDEPPEQASEAPPIVDGPATRLTALGEQVSRFRSEHQAFPGPPFQPAVPVDQRFNWILTLQSAWKTDGAQPDLEHGWADPVNDRFVRQRIDAFQNPAIPTLTGPAGHPVSHFVGIAGVGPDAAKLPIGDPRAGIFGYERITREADVRDGLANTMMVAGAQNGFDSWAANTSATIRSLTAEPYFGGPDGLGTGEQGGMSVLMADGSVRFLSADTDPRLMRRMAAMADGLPLDLSVPGEPGDVSEEPPPVADVAPPEPVETEDTNPIDVALAPDPVFDMETALGQNIVEFNQTTPRPVSEILKVVAEMGGFVIDSSQLDAASAERLQREVTFSLNDTTVRGILDAAVGEAGLTYSLGNGIVTLIARDAAATE